MYDCMQISYSERHAFGQTLHFILIYRLLGGVLWTVTARVMMTGARCCHVNMLVEPMRFVCR